MKVLFVNPSQIHFLNFQTGWTFGLKDVGYYQPLGILYVATYLKKEQPDVDIKVIDAASPDMPYPQLREIITQYKPDVVAISTYTQTFTDTLCICRIAKEHNPNTHVCLGGHHLFYYPIETLTHDDVDSIIIGEGEIKFAELIRQLKVGGSLEDLPGIFTRRNIDSLNPKNKSGWYLKDIQNLPYPDRSLVSDFQYQNILTQDRKMTTIISSRGCPFTCTFCPQGREPYRPRTSQDVVDEIEACQKHGFTDFFFSEDTFNINNKKVIDFCRELERRNVKASWCCKARIGDLNYETLEWMKKTGCYLINFGVETGTDEGLRQLQKGTTTQAIRHVFQWCRQLGIQTMAYFMIGHPFEKTHRDVHKNISFLISLSPDYCNINSVNPLPFTPLFDEGEKNGLLDYEPWKRYAEKGEMFIPRNWEEHLSKDEIQRLRIISLIRFYFRPRYLWKNVFAVTSFSDLLSKGKVAISLLLSFLLRGTK